MDNLQFDKCVISGVEIKRCRKTAHSYKMHLHNELTIGYIEEGATTVILGENEYSFEAGDGLIIPPLMSHMCSPDDIDNWQTVILYIDPKYYEDAIKFEKAIKLNEENIGKLKMFIGAIDEVTDETYLENLLIDLLLDCSVPDKQIESEADKISESILDFLINHYDEEIQLKTLEEKFGINKFTLIRKFKRENNTTPRAFQMQLKVAKAKNLLAKGVSVLDICNQVGFYDQAHFIREFKKMNGITPLAYTQDIGK